MTTSRLGLLAYDLQLMIASLYRAIRRSARPLKRIWIRRSNAAIFDEVYKHKFWGVGPDPNAPFYSGIGSYDPSVLDYIDLVKSIIRKHNVRSVTEIGCGDFAVASQYVDACSAYIGVDVVKGLIDRNSRMFASGRVRFICKDATKSKLDPSDLCIIRQVLQHVSNKDVQNILDNQQSKYLLITEHLPAEANIRAFNLDKKTGGDIRVQFGSGIFIDKPPFNLNAQALMERSIATDGSRLVTWIVKR
jgi:SAM-dependent methyltransferase